MQGLGREGGRGMSGGEESLKLTKHGAALNSIH